MNRIFLFLKVFAVFLLPMLLFSCSLFRPYKIPIQQGEKFSHKTISYIKPEMTKDQVLYLLGNPNANSPFEQNKWIYIYTNQHNYLSRSENKLILLFNDENKLENIEGDDYPPSKLTYKMAK